MTPLIYQTGPAKSGWLCSMREKRCRAQAASMARQSDSALRTLRRMQHERDKAFN